MIFGFSGTKRTVRNKRCPYYRGVRIIEVSVIRGVRIIEVSVL